jgi:hypothetical protein
MKPPRLSYRCDRAWDELTGQGAQRYCDRCDQVVHDLDAMSAPAREALLASPAPACVRWVTAALVAVALSAEAGAQEVRPGEGPLPDFAQKQEVMGPLDRRLIQEPIAAQSARLSELYSERLKKKPGLAGRISVKFTIERGVVTSAMVKSSTVGDRKLEQAVLELVQSISFETESVVVASYPFVFGEP